MRRVLQIVSCKILYNVIAVVLRCCIGPEVLLAGKLSVLLILHPFARFHIFNFKIHRLWHKRIVIVRFYFVLDVRCTINTNKNIAVRIDSSNISVKEKSE